MRTSDQTTLSICTRCRQAGDNVADTERPGYRLATRVHTLFPASDAAGRGVALRGVNCMSQCKRPCVIALSGPDKYTLVFGDLNASTDADAILRLAVQYANSPDGLVQRADRPKPLRTGILGRVPPLGWHDDLIAPQFTIPARL